MAFSCPVGAPSLKVSGCRTGMPRSYASTFTGEDWSFMPRLAGLSG